MQGFNNTLKNFKELKWPIGKKWQDLKSFYKIFEVFIYLIDSIKNLTELQRTPKYQRLTKKSNGVCPIDKLNKI